MCIVCQTISVGAAALTGILPVAVPEPEALHPIPAAVSPGAAQAASIGGTACKKLGQIRKTSAGSFRCSAVGKRKTWMPLQTAVTTSTSTTTTTTTTVPRYKVVETRTLTTSINNDLEISYISPINWGGLVASNQARMEFPIRLRSSVNADKIRVLVQHTSGTQYIMISCNPSWDWDYVKAGQEKIMNCQIPLDYIMQERNKGYEGGYSLNVWLAYGDGRREERVSVPIEVVLPTR